MEDGADLKSEIANCCVGVQVPPPAPPEIIPLCEIHSMLDEIAWRPRIDFTVSCRFCSEPASHLHIVYGMNE
jgi:hypothetical protein